MRFKLLIVSVDHYGYNGRDHHPKDSDIGLVVIPVKMEVAWYGEDGDFLDLATIDDGGDHAAVEALDTDNQVACWTCVTADGRILELMDHEVAMRPEETR